jgi:tRNA (cmo5U34)-methyltransferase
MAEHTIDFDSNPPLTANEYDQMAQLVLPAYEAMHTMALSCLRSRIAEQANLLIVGAGTGMELVKFGKANPQWQMLGVDPSEKMLAIAKDKIQQQGLSERVELFQGYTHDLPDTPLHDAATCILVMHFIPDDGSKSALLESIAQRLKSSAAFILVDVFGDKGSREFEQIISALKIYWEQMGIPKERTEDLLQPVYKGLYPLPESRVWELLQQAGFGNIIRFYTGLWVGGWIAIKN